MIRLGVGSVKYVLLVGVVVNLVVAVNSSHKSCFRNIKKFRHALGKSENKYYSAASNELQEKLLSSNSSKSTLSFVISPFWIEFLLVAISMDTTGPMLQEIDNHTQIHSTTMGKALMLNCIMENLPQDKYLKNKINNIMFIRNDTSVGQPFYNLVTEYAKISVDSIDVNDPELSSHLNELIRKINKRRMQDMFDDSDLDGNDTSIVILSSVYFKNRWLYSPTVLNGTWNFTSTSKNQTSDQVRMFRINGIMPYADVEEWDAKIVDIPYITKNISMMIFLPNKIDGLLEMEKKIMEHEYIINYTNKLMRKLPVAITLPKYSLESSIILPSKLKRMGISRLFSESIRLDDNFPQRTVKITNYVQELKLWADAGRYAFKDTGDVELPRPKVILMADHPFFFILKMNQFAVMMGHFSI